MSDPLYISGIPRLFERPRCAVLAFMAGLSQAAGYSTQLYVDALEAMLLGERTDTGVSQ